MNSKLKKIFCGCGILILLGIVFVIVGAALGGIKEVEKLEDKYDFISFGGTVTERHELESFENVDIEYLNEDVMFVEGDRFSVDITYIKGGFKPTVIVAGNSLKLTEGGDDIRGIVSIPVLKYEQPKVVITYPKGHEFEKIKCYISGGDLTMRSIKSVSTVINLDYGNVNITNSDLGATNIELLVSNTELSNVKTMNMELKTYNSSLYLNGSFFGENKITHIGNEDEEAYSSVSIESMIGMQEFKILADIKDGSLEIEEVNGLMDYDENGSVYYEGGNPKGTNSISILKFIGDIDIEFLK